MLNNWSIRLMLAAVAAFAVAAITAVIAAIVLAVADLYLAGHQLAEIRRPLSKAMTLSIADIMLLLASLGSGAAVFYATWRTRR